ncbi:MAG TPA: BTAD domain-containing putative transcriptional regulator [Streptosporangiaceae bacterium]|nr:BTAD domain-containing putative transcriptional regulator [Streptosporangiaceae bacterium]
MATVGVVGDHGSRRAAGRTAPVEVRLLGGFGLRVNGQDVPTKTWRLRKARHVVALLALSPGHRRHRDDVIEALWPDRGIESGLNNLHQALHIARRGMAGPGGSGRSRIRVRDEWVALCPDEKLQVDVEEFEAAAAAADGSPDCGTIEKALTLYRGDLLPEDRYEEWALLRRDELRARRRRLLTRLAALHETAGNPQTAISVLGPLVAEDPADESAQQALIRAYALSGDRGAALRQHEQLVAALRDQLAVPPDAATDRLYADVVAGKLSAGGSAAGRAAGNGGTMERENAPRHHPGPARGRPGAGHNLPVSLSTFIGRDRALAELGALIGQHRLITLTGPGGCGKTRLAVEAARCALADFPDGAWLTELARVSDTGEHAVGRALAVSLSLGERSGQSPLDAVIAEFADKRALLVIDNCEHLIDNSATAVAALLESCPKLVILATSREPLRVPGEVLWRVPSLEMPSQRRVPTLVELDACESVRLFVERAMAAQPGFALDENNAAAVAEICSRLDGLPLAIELAAARVPTLGVDGIAERLDDRFRLLTGGSRTLLSRQRTLAATFDWSYELLSPAEQAAFRRLSVFAETFSLPAAGAVVDGDGASRDDMAFVLPDLVGRSMVSIKREPAAVRYRLIETLREYGRTRLAEAGETESARRRHAAWYLTLAEEAAGHYADPGRRLWFERIAADQVDFRAALSSLQDTDHERALRLAAALWPHWVLHGSFGEGIERLEAALAASDKPSAARVEALLGAFAIKMRWTGVGEENPYAVQALDLARSIGDPLAIARAGFFTGVQSWIREQPGPARSAFLTAAAVARTAGLVLAEASAAHALACVNWSQGRPALARQRLREALALARRGTVQADASSFWQLTIGALVTDWWMGEPHLVLEETYVPFQENRGPAAVAYIRASMGSLARSEGDHGTARDLLAESLALFEDAGDEAGVALAFAGLGKVAIATREVARAREYLTRSLAIRRQLQDRRGIGLTLMSLGRLETGEDQLDEASELCTEAAASFRASGDRPAMILALTRLGELNIARAQRGASGQNRALAGADAVRLLESATAILRVMGHSAHLGLGLAALAEAYATAGGQERAADTATEAIGLLASGPAEPGREHTLRRLSVIAESAP